MKRIHKLFLFIIILLPVLPACKKSFLDLTPYNAFPLDRAIQSEADLNTAVNGMYNSLLSSNFYGRTLPLRGDLSADNVYLKTGNSGRYLPFRDFNPTVANTETGPVWSVGYDAINRANTVIHANVPASPIVDQLKGEAYALRALVHFELVRNYAMPYTVSPDGLGVPIVTIFDQNAHPARNTTKEVYAQIIEDFNMAYSLITLNQGQDLYISATNFTRTVTSEFISKYAVKGLLARVYQTMGDWAKAKEAALEVVNSSGFSLVSNGGLVSYWANPSARTDKVETLFEVFADATTNAGSNSLSNFYSLDGYGDAWVTDELYNIYSGTDVRRGVILANTTALPGKTIYLNNKYSNTSNSSDKDDTKIIRYADVLLILAEAYANTADDNNARTRLNELAQNRDAAFAGYASSGDQLKADIINERRKELAFEGSRYWDFMRLNLPITNHLKSQNPLVLFPVPANEPRRIFPIPQAEVDVNENIRDQQNPGY